jgi:RES domain-containing protein
LTGNAQKATNPILDFVWGALKGEFNDNPSFGQIIADTLIGMIDPVGVTDIRDLVAYGNKFSENPEEMKDFWNWVGVFGSIIGLVPVAGSAAKGLLKFVRKAADEFAERSLKQAIKQSIKLNHAVTNPQHVQGIVKEIDPKKLNPDSRFGPAFYLAENYQTAIIEVWSHGRKATNIVSFDLDSSQANILDLSNSKIASEWGYDSSQKQAPEVAKMALEHGFNVIKYPSVQGSENNYAVLKDFKELLTPGNIESVSANNIVPYNVVVRTGGRLSEIQEQNSQKK